LGDFIVDSVVDVVPREAGGRHRDEPAGTSSTSRPEWLHRRVLALVVVDAVAISIATWMSKLLSFGSGHDVLQVRGVHIPYDALAAAMIPAWLTVLGMCRAYDIGPFGTDSAEMRRVVSAAAHFLALIAVGYYLLHLQRLGRGFLIVIIPLATGLTLIGRFAARGWLQRRRTRGHMVRRAILLGPRRQAEALAAHLIAHPSSGIRPIAGLVPDAPDALVTSGRSIPVVGTPDHVLEALAATKADLLLITASLVPGELRKLTWQLEGTGIDVIVAPTMGRDIAPRFDVRPVAGLPLLYIDRARPTAGPGRV
jgi:FlaA1/EpsC-like NDP-sugar epimerase